MASCQTFTFTDAHYPLLRIWVPICCHFPSAWLRAQPGQPWEKRPTCGLCAQSGKPVPPTALSGEPGLQRAELIICPRSEQGPSLGLFPLSCLVPHPLPWVPAQQRHPLCRVSTHPCTGMKPPKGVVLCASLNQHGLGPQNWLPSPSFPSQDVTKSVHRPSVSSVSF